MSRRSFRWLSPLVAAVLSALWLGVSAAPIRAQGREGPRLALVVGGPNDGARRTTSAADAGLVAQALAQAGFDVTAQAVGDADTLRAAAAAFADKLRRTGGDAVVFLYLSGEGAQKDGANVFVPAAARIARQDEIPARAVPLDEIVKPIEALPARARIFVLDLARDEAVAKADPIPLAAGLTLAHAPKGSLYAYDAAPGMIAAPDAPPYGLYARALAEALRTPGLATRALFARVRLRVAEMTGGAVVPWDESDLDGELTLLPAEPTALRPAVADRPIAGLPVEEVFWAAIAEDSLTGYDAFLNAFPDDRLAVRVKALAAARLEAETWTASVEANAAAAYWTYMLRYPHGPHYVDVRRRLAAIHAALAPPPRFEVYDFAGLPKPPSLPPAAGDGRDAPAEADWPTVPAVPGDLLPPPPEAIYATLPPPPLVPKGALPVPMPLPLLAAMSRPGAPGRIVQPAVPYLGAVSFESGLGQPGVDAMTLSTTDRIVSRITVEAEKTGRTVLQTDADNRVQSRTRTTREGDRLTIVQTGPTGGILVKMVTVAGRDGARTTTLTNGASQMVAAIHTDGRGVETGLTFGAATLGKESFLAPVPDEAKRLAKPTAPPLPPEKPPTLTNQTPGARRDASEIRPASPPPPQPGPAPPPPPSGKPGR